MAEKTTIARPYAQAIFELAQEQKTFGKWSEMLELATAVAVDADMAALIDSPRVGRDQVVEIFLDVCGDKLDESGKSMVRVLAENDRLEFLPEIAALYEIERARAEGSLEADVITAQPLTDAQAATIAAALKKRFGREISLKCTTDESLIGGAIIRAGDIVIDGSAVGRLQKLHSELAH